MDREKSFLLFIIALISTLILSGCNYPINKTSTIETQQDSSFTEVRIGDMPEYKSLCEEKCGGNLNINTDGPERGKGYLLLKGETTGKKYLKCSCSGGIGNAFGPLDESKITTTQDKSANSSILPSIKEFFSKLSSSLSSSSCPQIKVSLTQNQELLPSMNLKEFDGWSIAPYDSNTMLGFNFGRIFCHKGSKEGQNSNYWYCGDKSSQTTMAFMQKTFVNSDGTIGKTVKQSFVNIYDKDGNFIKTVCGEDPDKIAEREFKQQMNEMDKFFG